MMKASKVVAVAAVVVGLSYGGYLASRAEPKAAVVKESAEEPDSGAVIAKRPKYAVSNQRATRHQQRAQLLAAIETARKGRLAHVAVASRESSGSQASSSPELTLGVLDKDYIREQMDEILPLVTECYEETLLRRPDVSGTAVVEFSIVGEEGVGGLVELSEFDHEASTIDDEEFSECIQETMYGLELEPPDGGGQVVVRYPFAFNLVRDDEEEGE